MRAIFKHGGHSYSLTMHGNLLNEDKRHKAVPILCLNCLKQRQPYMNMLDKKREFDLIVLTRDIWKVFCGSFLPTLSAGTFPVSE